MTLPIMQATVCETPTRLPRIEVCSYQIHSMRDYLANGVSGGFHQ
jgi:hypothetical protein